MNTRTHLTVVLATILLSILGAAPAHAAPGGCTVITYLPYSITQPGCYCLAENMTVALGSGKAITINADNVVIDLDGYTIDNRSAGASTSAIGIYAVQRENITVRNGTLRGFYHGVSLAAESSTTVSGLIVERMLIAESPEIGIRLYNASGGVVRDNTILNSSPVIPGHAGVGILASGPNLWIHDNTVVGTSTRGRGMDSGIQVGRAPNSVVERNKVGNNRLFEGSRGIAVVESDNVIVAGNRIAGVSYGLEYSSSTGKYRENITSGVATPYAGGTDAGNNF